MVCASHLGNTATIWLNVRGIILRKMVGEGKQLTTESRLDLSQLPPCRDNLIPHIYQVNHGLVIYMRAYITIFWFRKPYDPEQGRGKKLWGIFGANIILWASTFPFFNRLSWANFGRTGTVWWHWGRTIWPRIRFWRTSQRKWRLD